MRFPSLMLLLTILTIAGCKPGPQSVAAPLRPAPRGFSNNQLGIPTATSVGIPPPAEVVPPRGLKDDEFEKLERQMDEVAVDEAIQLLENRPEMIGLQHSTKGSLLQHAVVTGRTQLVRFLLERGANPNERVMWGFNAVLNCICSVGYNRLEIDGPGRICSDEILELLLLWGADPNATSNLFHLTLQTEQGEIKPTDTMLEVGEKFQRCRFHHSIDRNAVVARLREGLGLPLDAMLPLNANSLYLKGNPVHDVRE